MAARVFLHIGTMKSATTYLQDLCSLNRERLAAAGVYWSQAELNFTAVSDLLGPKGPGRSHDGDWSTFKAAIDGHRGSALISNELLSLRKRRRLRSLLGELEPADIQVIITARDLGRVIPSQWQEGARHRRMPAWPEFTQALMDDRYEDDAVDWFWRRQDLTRIIDDWARLVGPDRIWLVTVPPAGSEYAAVGRRFLSVLGVDGADGWSQPSMQNPTLGAHSAELMRRVHERFDADDRERYRLTVKHTLTRSLLARRAPVEPPIRLSAEQLTWARARSEQMIDDIADAGIRVVGDAAELLPVDQPASGSVAPGEATTEELLDAAVDAVVGLVGVVSVLREREEDLS